jgi:hypothetical protein
MKVFVAFLGLIVLMACAPTTSSSTGAAAAAAPATPKAVTMSATGTLASGEASQVAGTAQVTALADNKVQIVVTLSGLPANSTHMGHIHIGDCSAVGQVFAGLSEITSDASGNGTATTEAKGPLPADAYIAYHQRGPTDPEGIGSFISCGNIPK